MDGNCLENHSSSDKNLTEETISAEKNWVEVNNSTEDSMKEDFIEESNLSEEDSIEESSSAEEDSMEESSLTEEGSIELSSSSEEDSIEESSSGEDLESEEDSIDDSSLMVDLDLDLEFEESNDPSLAEEDSIEESSSGEDLDLEEDSLEESSLGYDLDLEFVDSDNPNLAVEDSLEESSSNEENSANEISLNEENSTENNSLAEEKSKEDNSLVEDHLAEEISSTEEDSSEEKKENWIEVHGLVFQDTNPIKRHRTVQIVMLGSGDCGKRKVIENVFGDHASFTVTIHEKRTEFHISLSTFFHIKLWDVTDPKFVRKMKFPEKTVFLLCYDVDNPRSFARLEGVWVQLLWKGNMKNYFWVGINLDSKTVSTAIATINRDELKKSVEKKVKDMNRQVLSGEVIECSIEDKRSLLNVFQSCMDIRYPRL